MQEEYVLLLLRAIKYRLSSHELLERGLHYSQVLRLLSNLEGSDLITLSEKRFVLTDEGHNKLLELESKFFPGIKSDWLLPEEKERISKVGKLDVYLPKGMD